MITIEGNPTIITGLDFTNKVVNFNVMPVYNPIVWTVSSDNTAQCNFKYICDIYVNSTFVKTLYLSPNENDQADFKVNKVLEDYIQNNYVENLFGVTNNNGRLISYQLNFGEQYDTSTDCNQTPVDYIDLKLSTTIGNFFAFNGAMQFQEWVDYNNEPSKFIFSPLNNKIGKFLTNAPSTILIGMGEQAELSFLNMPSLNRNQDDIYIKTYRKDGSVIATNSIQNTFSNADITLPDTLYVTVGVGPENINNYFNDIIINSDVHHYDVYLGNNCNNTFTISNPTFQYLSGANFWTTNSYPGCSSSFGVTVANKMVLSIPDVSCADTFISTYTGTGFIPGQKYTITVNVDTINNPSGGAQSINIDFGGVLQTPKLGTGTKTWFNITCGPTGVLKLVAYMDADTGGYGSHSFSMTSISVTQVCTFARTSEIKTYEIDRRPSKYKKYRFRWLNRLGGYDSYAYTFADKRSINITRTEYDTLNGSFDGTKWNYNKSDRGRTISSVTAKETVNVNSNWLTEPESIWMEELFTSPETMLITSNIIVPFSNVYTYGFVGDPPIITSFDASCYKFDFNTIPLFSEVFVDRCTKTINTLIPNIVVPSWPTNLVGLAPTNTLSVLNIPGISSILTNPDCGILYPTNFISISTPIILTVSTPDIKQKYTTKNINYPISFEYAFNKNIQRN